MSTANAVVRYCIKPLSPQAHLFQINMTIASPDPKGQVLSLPAWIPGSYMIRDFAKNLVQLRAHCSGNALAINKLDKQTWQIEACNGILELDYEIYAWDLSVRSAHLDQSHGYFNGTSVFLRVHNQDHLPCEVEIVAPQGEQYANWQVSTAMRRNGASLHGFGKYIAVDYDELVDHPVELGEFTLLQFEACGVPHDVAITGKHYTDEQRLLTDLKAICEKQIRFFGEPAPFDRYVFQVMVVGEGYGGLEHRASTSLLCARDDLPRPGMKELSESYQQFLGLCSHEYFHSWHVKRIKPALFFPYDLRHEVHTELLWVFEGFTSYYDELFMRRAGVITDQQYLQMLGQGLTRVLRGLGRFKQSIAESSFDAWTKFYKQDENSPNAIVSYYTKGAMVALALDLYLRQESEGAFSLDLLMKHLWREYGAKGIGLPERRLEPLLYQLSGIDVQQFFAHYVYGTQDPPLAELLAKVAIDYQLRGSSGQADQGGKPANIDSNAVSLGVRTSSDPVGAKLTMVFENGAAQQAGLAAGDVLIALDGLQINGSNLEKRLNYFRPGERVTAHAFRRDELREFELVMQSPALDTCVLAMKKEATESELARRRVWFNGD